MKAYLVWYDNGQSWSDHNRWTGGLYSSKEEAEKEILDSLFIKDDTTESYVVNKVDWAKLENETYGYSSDDPNSYTPADCYAYDFATIEEVQVLEKYIPKQDAV